MIHAYDTTGARHICIDETATCVNDRWLCKCLGGPFFTEQPVTSDRTYRRIHGAAEALREKGISFESSDHGSHLIVHHNGLTLDFYPITGKFIPRWKDRVRFKPTKGLKGVEALLNYLGE